ncbi:MAG: type IX secretion system outer membrane channel protein PorV [Balneola sp.]|jgi:hypothetical protein|tara:strand:- start:39532 stop:40671 length:1140 start_codon:yes stop_codon:yes gene_type:complete
MNRNLLLLITSFFILFSTTTIKAQVGITGVPFLQIEADSRGAGMGNTGVALADNAAALFWNPAGLAYQKDNQASFTHSNWLANFGVNDLFYDYLVVKQYVEGIGTIGGHITFLNLGEQLNTTEGGEEGARFNSYEFAIGLSYGTEVSKNLALGGGARLIYSSLASGIQVGGQKINPGSSVGIDISALYKTDPFDFGSSDAIASFGINLSNLGPGIQYSDNAQKDPLPTVLRFGPAINFGLDEDRINELTVAVDITKIMARQEAIVTEDDTTFRAVAPLKALIESWGTYRPFDPNTGTRTSVSLMEQFMIGAGLEYWYDRKFAIRGGYYYESPDNGDREFITFGAGLRYNQFGVDFSYIKTLESQSPLANTLRFSILLNY